MKWISSPDKKAPDCIRDKVSFFVNKGADMDSES